MSNALWVRSGSKIHGPFSTDDLRRLFAAGKLKYHHEISADQQTWKPIGKVKGLGSTPADQPGSSSPSTRDAPSGKAPGRPNPADPVSAVRMDSAPPVASPPVQAQLVTDVEVVAEVSPPQHLASAQTPIEEAQVLLDPDARALGDDTADDTNRPSTVEECRCKLGEVMQARNRLETKLAFRSMRRQAIAFGLSLVFSTACAIIGRLIAGEDGLGFGFAIGALLVIGSIAYQHFGTFPQPEDRQISRLEREIRGLTRQLESYGVPKPGIIGKFMLSITPHK